MKHCLWLLILAGTLAASDEDAEKAIVAAGGKVERDNGGSITTLTFEIAHLTEKAVAAITRLPQTKYLALHNTDLSDDMLRKFGGLEKLQVLFIGGTQVTDLGLRALKG